jgi:hypothetical protein
MHTHRLTLVTALLAASMSYAAAKSHAAGVDYAHFVPIKNIYGQPDIGGVWSNATTTSFERPSRFADHLALTEAEAAQVQGAAEAYRAAGDAPTDPKAGPPTDRDTNRGYNRFWTDPGTSVMRVHGEPRSSMITTTPDGRVPPRKPDAPPAMTRTAAGAPSPVIDENGPNAGPNEGPESRALSERCIFMQTSAGPVLRPVLYNNNYRITQGRDSVAIEVEMIHDVRIVRIGAKHRDDGIRPWMGDSIGWYEGNTLVVETTSFNPQQPFYGASEQLKVTERFTRVASNRLLYRFTVDDPKVWDKPWGGEYEFWASPGLYEYACHEGNYGLYNILAGARAEEKRAADAKAQAAH